MSWIRSAVLTQYQLVTDRQMDEHKTKTYTALISRPLVGFLLYFMVG